MTVLPPRHLHARGLGSMGRLVLGAAVVALVTTASCRGSQKRSASDATASLATAGGAVTIVRDGKAVAAAPGLKLVVGDIISTGSDGKAEVSLWNGHVLRLGPISSVAIGDGVGLGDAAKIVLQQGDLRAVTGRGDAVLVIGTPFGRVDIPGGSDVEVSSKGNLIVHMGSIDVTFADGKRLTIPTGGRFADGKVTVAPSAARSGTHVVTQPLRFALTTQSRQVQIKRALDKNWQASKSRETLAAGDSVRTRAADDARLQLDDRSSVLLRPSTDIMAKESGLTANGSIAHLVLRSGGAKLLASRNADGIGGHDVEAAGHRLHIEPGAEEANVDVFSDQDGAGRVVVHLGRVSFPDGQTVEAGTAVAFGNGRPTGAPAPLAKTFIELRPGRKAEVYCGGRVPAVKLTWEPGGAKPPFVVELARDERYKARAFREEVSQPSLVYGLLRPGSWFWRVQQGDGWQTGAVRVEHDRDADCTKCKRHNVVDDTGRETTVYFQGPIPAITLQGTTITGAAKYRIKVYADNALDKPFIDETLATPVLSLAAGRLHEGRYAWNVQALAGDSSALLTGPVNGLTIAYDNTASGLQIRVPRVGATAKGTTTWTKGELAGGQKLVINGRPVELDEKGRFAEEVALAKGPNQITYHVPGGKRDQYWVRDIVAN